MSRSSMSLLAAPSVVSGVYKHSPIHTYTPPPTRTPQAGSFSLSLTPPVQCWILVLCPKALKRCPLQSRGHPCLAGRTPHGSKASQQNQKRCNRFTTVIFLSCESESIFFFFFVTHLNNNTRKKSIADMK